MQKYVLCLVVNDKNNFIGLTKNRGWEFLIGKKTCPGGKIEGDEPLEFASSRELEEETGVWVDPSQWLLAGKKDDDRFELYLMVAKSEAVENAFTKETEPVWVGNLQYHMDRARDKSTQDEYVPDFVEFMTVCLNKLNIKVS